MAKIVTKYTGLAITEDDLYGKPAAEFATLRAIEMTAENIHSVERSLTRAAVQLRELADKIDSNVNAGPSDRVYGLNPLGELQGNESGRVNSTIATRDALIDQLKTLVHLYRGEIEARGAVVPVSVGDSVLVTPLPVGGRPARAPFVAKVTGTIVASNGRDRGDLLWVTDAMGQEIEVSAKILTRIEAVTIKGYND
jgi:hypothetical protein